jgi:DNA-binding MarR family transcriptional regulator
LTAGFGGKEPDFVQHRHDKGFLKALGRAETDASRPDLIAASPEQRQMLREHASLIRSARDLRQESFDRNIFGEPAWEMLLALYVIDGEQRRLSTRQVAKLASLSLTTTLRWLDYLEEQDLVSRQTNPFDHRVVYTELSDKGRAAMDTYLMRNCGADVMGSIASSDR